MKGSGVSSSGLVFTGNSCGPSKSPLPLESTNVSSPCVTTIRVTSPVRGSVGFAVGPTCGMGAAVLILLGASPSSSVSPWAPMMPPLVKNDTAVPGGTGLPNRSAALPSTEQIISKNTWPAMLTKLDATDKWAAEGGPPVMLTFVEELVRVFVPTVTLALIRTGPATVPLVNTVDASPA